MKPPTSTDEAVHDIIKHGANSAEHKSNFSILGSLALAVVLNKALKGIVFFRTIYFLPTISSGVAIFVLWRWLYNTDIGLFNSVMRQFGELININLQV